jgi:hypothetical protein
VVSSTPRATAPGLSGPRTPAERLATGQARRAAGWPDHSRAVGAEAPPTEVVGRPTESAVPT